MLADALDGVSINVPVYVPNVCGYVTGVPVFPVQRQHDGRRAATHAIDPTRPYGRLLHKSTPALPTTPSAPSAQLVPSVPSVPVATGLYRPQARTFFASSFSPSGPHTTPVCRGCMRCDAEHVCAASILLVDPVTDEIVLVRQRDGNHGGQYGEPGGRYDAKDRTSENTAARETYEETRGTVVVSPAVIASSPSVQMAAGRHWMKTYIVKQRVSCSKFYATDVQHLPREYNETDRMTRFSLPLMRAHYARTCTILLQTNDGKTKPVTGRCEAALKLAFDAGLL